MVVEVFLGGLEGLVEDARNVRVLQHYVMLDVFDGG